MSRTIKLVIEYDGTNYIGWQIQKSGNRSRKSEVRSGELDSRFHGNDNNKVLTIQGLLQEAIIKITGEDIKVTGAGRTDSGVHAKGQVASFQTSSGIAIEALPLAINAHLPDDIAVLSAEEAGPDFNARRSAKAREYRYVINNGRSRSALHRMYSFHVPVKLDVDAMKRATGYFIGRHDFSGFMAGHGTEEFRDIMKLDIEKTDDFVYITVKANSFLMHMVRYMVAALVEVGKGKMRPEDIKKYLEPSPMKWTHSRAPAKGLFLMKVEY